MTVIGITRYHSNGIRLLVRVCIIIGLMTCAWPVGECKEIRLAWMVPGSSSNRTVTADSSVGALKLALRSVAGSSNILRGHTVRAKLFETDCHAQSAIAVAMEARKTFDPDVIIGPPCEEGMKMVAHLSRVWNLPVFSWFNTGPVFDNQPEYPTLIRLIPPLNIMAKSFVNLLNQHGWRKFFLFFDESAPWRMMEDAIRREISQTHFRLLGAHLLDKHVSDTDLNLIFTIIKRYSTIMVFACPAQMMRRYVLAATRAGLNKGQYVFIQLDHEFYPESVLQTEVLSSGSWRHGDADDDEARRAYEQVIRLVINPKQDEVTARSLPQNRYTEFCQLAISEANNTLPEWHLPGGTSCDVHSLFLYDAVLVWAILASNLQETGLSHRDGTLMAKRLLSAPPEVSGATGNVNMTLDLDRTGTVFILDMDSDGNFQPAQIISSNTDSSLSVIDVKPSDQLFRWGGGRSGISETPRDSLVTDSITGPRDSLVTDSITGPRDALVTDSITGPRDSLVTDSITDRKTVQNAVLTRRPTPTSLTPPTWPTTTTTTTPYTTTTEAMSTTTESPTTSTTEALTTRKTTTQAVDIGPIFQPEPEIRTDANAVAKLRGTPMDSVREILARLIALERSIKSQGNKPVMTMGPEQANRQDRGRVAAEIGKMKISDNNRNQLSDREPLVGMVSHVLVSTTLDQMASEKATVPVQSEMNGFNRLRSENVKASGITQEQIRNNNQDADRTMAVQTHIESNLNSQQGSRSPITTNNQQTNNRDNNRKSEMPLANLVQHGLNLNDQSGPENPKRIAIQQQSNRNNIPKQENPMTIADLHGLNTQNEHGLEMAAADGIQHRQNMNINHNSGMPIPSQHTPNENSQQRATSQATNTVPHVNNLNYMKPQSPIENPPHLGFNRDNIIGSERLVNEAFQHDFNGNIKPDFKSSISTHSSSNMNNLQKPKPAMSVTNQQEPSMINQQDQKDPNLTPSLHGLVRNTIIRSETPAANPTQNVQRSIINNQQGLDSPIVIATQSDFNTQNIPKKEKPVAIAAHHSSNRGDILGSGMTVMRPNQQGPTRNTEPKSESPMTIAALHELTRNNRPGADNTMAIGIQWEHNLNSNPESERMLLNPTRPLSDSNSQHRSKTQMPTATQQVFNRNDNFNSEKHTTNAEQRKLNRHIRPQPGNTVTIESQPKRNVNNIPDTRGRLESPIKQMLTRNNRIRPENQKTIPIQQESTINSNLIPSSVVASKQAAEILTSAGAGVNQHGQNDNAGLDAMVEKISQNVLRQLSGRFSIGINMADTSAQNHGSGIIDAQKAIRTTTTPRMPASTRDSNNNNNNNNDLKLIISQLSLTFDQQLTHMRESLNNITKNIFKQNNSSPSETDSLVPPPSSINKLPMTHRTKENSLQNKINHERNLQSKIDQNLVDLISSKVLQQLTEKLQTTTPSSENMHSPNVLVDWIDELPASVIRDIHRMSKRDMRLRETQSKRDIRQPVPTISTDNPGLRGKFRSNISNSQRVPFSPTTSSTVSSTPPKSLNVPVMAEYTPTYLSQKNQHPEHPNVQQTLPVSLQPYFSLWQRFLETPKYRLQDHVAMTTQPTWQEFENQPHVRQPPVWAKRDMTFPKNKLAH